jgi:hypothetical protein
MPEAVADADWLVEGAGDSVVLCVLLPVFVPVGAGEPELVPEPLGLAVAGLNADSSTR